jgi:hypothetical protein
MVVRQVNDIQGDRKQFLEELLGQPLAENEQVYIMVCAGDSTEEACAPDAGEAEHGGGWSAAKNERRGELIDRHIQGSIAPEERVELDFLQQQFHEYQEQNWPLPIDKARELHRELLEKKRQQDASQR